MKIKHLEASSISALVETVTQLEVKPSSQFLFSGKRKYFCDTSIIPSIYRKPEYIKRENIIHWKSQRLNDHEFITGRVTLDRPSRIQNYLVPTKLLDIDMYIFSGLYSVLVKRLENEKYLDAISDAIAYVLEIKKNNIKYYDSDAVNALSNLSKLPIKNTGNDKLKGTLLIAISNRDGIYTFNNLDTTKYLLRKMREEKSYFKPLTCPKNITSVQRTSKLINERFRPQKSLSRSFGFIPRMQ